MSQENKITIEIQGVKMEVDLRHAKRIDTITVGSRVKVLRKKYGDIHEVLHGIVIGFEPFKELPTVIIALARIEYNEAKVEFLYYNSQTKDVEVVVAHDDDVSAIDKSNFILQVDREVAKLELQIRELKDRRTFFLEKFQCYWAPLEAAVQDATSQG